MNTTMIILAVSAALILSVVLRLALQPRIRRTQPRTRYRIVTVLLVVGAASQGFGAIVAAVTTKGGFEIVFLATGLLLSMACVLEMRKLRREF